MSIASKAAVREQAYGEFATLLNTMDRERAASGLPSLTGRQFLWLMFQRFRTNRLSTGLATRETFQNLVIAHDNLPAYMTRWKQILCDLGDDHESHFLYRNKTAMFWKQVKGSTAFSQVRDIVQLRYLQND